jgi:hypothetical protein
MKIYRLILLLVRNFFEDKFVENLNTHIYNQEFFPKIVLCVR